LLKLASTGLSPVMETRKMTILRKLLIHRWALVLSALAALFALAAPGFTQDQAPADDPPGAVGGQGYGYFRLVDGPATVVPTGGDQAAAAEVNQPVLAGDRLSVPRHAKVEVLLADQNILRVDGGSELIFERLAASPDRQDRATVLRLLAGNVQLIVTTDSLGDELPRVETPNATIYPQYYGSYRLTADDGYSQVVVRSGSAQVVTDNGSWKVRADEQAVVDDHSADRQAQIGEAGAFDSLERWGRQLDDEYAGAAQAPGVDDSLRYAAAPLGAYGAWITVGGAAYWRPRVNADWRPYWQGRWIYTPSGLTWVSSEPWGWVPYHYGSWSYLDGYGWAWQPGSVWSPAWVYWYWGPDYTGWCPTAYYTSYYGIELGAGAGFRWGLYGWAGGGWGLFDHWNFVSSSYFDYAAGYRQGYRDGFWDAHRDVQRYAVPIDGREHGPLARGIITTDTKPLKPSVWKDPGGPLRALRGKSPTELPDVTPFIARQPHLPTAIANRVVDEKPQRLDGTPLRPSTLGRPGRQVEAGRAGVQAGVQGAQPGRPGRPGPAVDGGAPNPRVSGDRGNRGNGADRGGRGDRTAVRGGQPGRHERRPAPEADGGAPRPSRQPAVRESRPPERQPAAREKPPERKPDDDKKDRKPPRS
jgi:hypothetical protein